MMSTLRLHGLMSDGNFVEFPTHLGQTLTY